MTEAVNRSSENVQIVPNEKSTTESNRNLFLALAVGTAAFALGAYGAYKGGFAQIKMLNHKNSCIGLAAVGLTIDVAAAALGFSKTKTTTTSGNDSNIPVSETSGSETEAPISGAGDQVKKLRITYSTMEHSDIQEAIRTLRQNPGHSTITHIKATDSKEYLSLAVNNKLYLASQGKDALGFDGENVLLGSLVVAKYTGSDLGPPQDEDHLLVLFTHLKGFGMTEVGPSNRYDQFANLEMATLCQFPGTSAKLTIEGAPYSLKSTDGTCVIIPYSRQKINGTIYEGENGQSFYLSNDGKTEIRIAHFDSNTVDQIVAAHKESIQETRDTPSPLNEGDSTSDQGDQ